MARTSDGGAFLAGVFRSTATFGLTNLTAAGDNDAFLARYDDSGEVLWALRIGGSTNDAAYSVAAGPDDSAYVVGYFVGAVSIGGEMLSSRSINGTDAFLAKYAADGTPVFGRFGLLGCLHCQARPVSLGAGAKRKIILVQLARPNR